MSRRAIQGLRLRLPGKRVAELLFVAIVMALLTLFTGDLPQLEVIESTIKDDQFTDFVITTQGELPIDTNIVVITYGPEIMDSAQRVDRGMLAQGLAAIFEMKPRAVAVDFLIEDERPESPDSDAMLAGLIADHPDDLIFGIFREDSLNRFRTPPPSFGLTNKQLGCINLQQGDDQTVRTFDRSWTAGGESYEDLSVKVARRIDSNAAAHLASFDANTFIIDYAGGIGEHRGAGEENGVQVFPSFPLARVTGAVFSDNPEERTFFEERLKGKGVMVGYADLRTGQVTSIVDRFTTPLKAEKNDLPDMHGVAVHANILNTILQRRIVYEVPGWINVIWGTIIVFLLYYGYEALRRVRPLGRRAFLMYPGFAILLAIGLIVPILLFRDTSYKLSIYTPFAGLLLGPLVLGIFDKLKRILLDFADRRRLRRPMPEEFRRSLASILSFAEPNERYVQGLHVLQRFFHACCDRLFAEGMRRDDFAFSHATVASPTPSRIRHALDEIDPATWSQGSRDAAALIDALIENPLLRRSLRVARSLVIALNEINRQNAALEEEERDEEGVGENLPEEEQEYTDMVMAAVGGMVDTSDYENSDDLYSALEAFVRRGAEILQKGEGMFREVPGGEAREEMAPFIVRERCQVHNREEVFVYLSEQEDANNRDDYFDLLYAGETMRCRPEEHPGLTGFREERGSDQKGTGAENDG